MNYGDLNRISTHFTALPTKEIQGLYEHSRWQVHAMHALYWNCQVNMGRAEHP